MKITIEKAKSSRPLKIVQAKYLSDYVVRIVFNDSTEKEVDFKSFLTQTTHPEIAKYRDEKMFKKFRIVGGNINWNDYDLIFPISDLYLGAI